MFCGFPNYRLLSFVMRANDRIIGVSFENDAHVLLY